MFCSKCGKTLMPEDTKCPHCGLAVGESRFAGTPYTSAQPWIRPDTPANFVEATYARANYTTIPEEELQRGGADSRTNYRPLNNGAGSAPDEVREDMRAALDPQSSETDPEAQDVELSEEAINTLNAVDEELQIEDMDVSDLNPAPIESTGRAGISAGVSDYVAKLEASQNRKAARRHRRVYDDSEQSYTTPEGAGGAAYDARENADPNIDTQQSEVFDDLNEEEMDEIRYGREISLKDILRVALIMVVAAALIVGGVLWFRHVRGNQSAAPIEGVTESVYNDGLATIKAHAGNDYVTEMMQLYSSEGMTAVTLRATEDINSLSNLLPAEPAVNDQLFVSALQAIQLNIGNAVLMDGLEISSGSPDAQANSQRRWDIVNNAITQLESATTAQELTGILNGETITASTSPTPTPAPTVMYQTLSKGDKNDDVLEMQTRLYQLGFLLDDRDGAFGTKTQTAVKQFQQYAGLEVTGIADAATLTVLYSDTAPRTEYAQITPTPVPTPSPTPEPVEETEEEGETAAE